MSKVLNCLAILGSSCCAQPGKKKTYSRDFPSFRIPHLESRSDDGAKVEFWGAMNQGGHEEQSGIHYFRYISK